MCIDCVGEKRIQGLIKRSLADKGVPLQQYFVPFKAKLKSTNCDMMEGVIGTEHDAIDIIKGTPASYYNRGLPKTIPKTSERGAGVGVIWNSITEVWGKSLGEAWGNVLS